MVTKARNHDRLWAYTIGAGLAISPIHNQWLTNLFSNDEGEVFFFLPAFGYLLLIMGAGLFLLNNWDRVKEAGWGDRRIIGCLLFIVLAIAASGAAYEGLEARFAPMGMGLALIGLYLAGRLLGKDVFIPLVIGAGIASVGIIISAISNPGILTGGLVFEKNYNIASAYITIGAIVAVYSQIRWSYVLASVVGVALFLTGAPEMVFFIAILALAVILKRDYGKRLLLVLAPVILVAVVWFGLGYGWKLYDYSAAVAVNTPVVELPSDDSRSLDGIEGDTMLERRWTLTKDAFMNIKPLGEGYNLTNYDYKTAHSIPGIIVQQLGYPGVLALLAWLFITIWALVKTKWTYLWVAILAMGVFDHYLWTQLAPLWPLAVGVATTQTIKKGEHNWVFRQKS